MSGTIKTFRPNQEAIDNAGGYAASAGGSLAAVCSDQSDATWMSGDATGTVVLGFDQYNLAADERVLRVRPRLRCAMPFGTTTMWWTLGNFALGQWLGEERDDAHTIGGFTGAWRTAPPGDTEWDQAWLNQVQMRFRSNLTGGATVLVYEQSIEAEVVTRPTVNVSAPSGTNPGSTHRPTVVWTAVPNDGAAQKKYRVRVFNTAINPSPGFDDTSGRVYDSGAVSGTATTHKLATAIPNGEYVVLMRIAKDFNNTDWWSITSNVRDFTISDAPPVPTLVGPTGPIITGFPLLQAQLARSNFEAPYAVYAEWQTASDAGFAADVLSYVEDPAINADNGGLHWKTTQSTLPTGPPPLAPATWYLRARARDKGGGIGAWSDGVTFDVAYAGTVAPRFPTSGQYVPIGDPLLVWWDFTGWLPDDYPVWSQYVILDELDNVVFDTGKVELPGPYFTDWTPTVEGAYGWQARTWDEHNVATEWTPIVRFRAEQLGTVLFDAAVTPEPVVTPGPTVAWINSLVFGRTQVSYRLVVTDDADGSVRYDSGVVASAVETIDLPVDAVTSGHAYTFALTIVDSAGLPTVSPASMTRTVGFAPPAALDGLVSAAASHVPASALPGVFGIGSVEYAQMSWTGTDLGEFFDAYEIERDEAGEWVQIARLVDEALSFFADHEGLRSVAGVVSMYRVRVAHRFLGMSDWAEFDPVSVRCGNDTDVILVSNATPDLTCAYHDEGPYQFAVMDIAKTVRLQGRAKPIRFRAPDADGDTFTRKLIVAQHDSELVGDDAGRVVFGPLLARIRDTAAPYVALLDGYGHRWMCGLEFVAGDQNPALGSYLATVAFTEVASSPTPLQFSIA